MIEVVKQKRHHGDYRKNAAADDAWVADSRVSSLKIGLTSFSLARHGFVDCSDLKYMKVKRNGMKLKLELHHDGYDGGCLELGLVSK